MLRQHGFILLKQVKYNVDKHGCPIKNWKSRNFSGVDLVCMPAGLLPKQTIKCCHGWMNKQFQPTVFPSGKTNCYNLALERANEKNCLFVLR